MGVCASTPADYGEITPNQEYGEKLKAVPLFAKFTLRDCSKLGALCVEKVYKRGRTIIKQGEKGTGFFIVVDGRCVVKKKVKVVDTGALKEIEIAQLGVGDYFGEAALLNDCERRATVVSKEDVTCLYLARQRFNAMFGGNRFAVDFARRKSVSDETALKRVQAQQQQEIDRGVREKTDELRNMILESIADNLLFARLTHEERGKIVDMMWRREFPPGSTIIKQGNRGDMFYVVEHGRCDVFVDEELVATCDRGRAFGELALMYNSPRAATVVVNSDEGIAVLWCVDRVSYKRELKTITESERKELLDDLRSVDILTPLSRRERVAVADALEVVTFTAGSIVFSAGDVSDCMYIVRSGDVEIRSEQGDVLMHCTKNIIFGERSLLKDDVRHAHAVCITDVVCMYLKREDFYDLLGPLEDLMNRRIVDYESKSQILLRGVAAMSVSTTNMSEIRLEQLSRVGVMGYGSFGTVELVRYRSSKSEKFFALKTVHKARIVEHGQQAHILSEKLCMEQMDHPFVVKLHATYKDKDRLYFLMEPCLGGELCSLLREHGSFTEDQARFYLASIVLAMQHIHERKVLYRDVKPENILIDADGYVKLVDFGFAKMMSTSERTFTLCGTPDYLAPEIIQGSGHGFAADFWTIGILLFEMMSGYPPFYDHDELKTYSNIMDGNIRLPSHFSPNARDLIIRLLRHSPGKRLGITKGGVDRLKEHAWFKDFDWTALANKSMEPPFMPSVSGDSDLSNFSPSDDNNRESPPYVDDESSWFDEF